MNFPWSAVIAILASISSSSAALTVQQDAGAQLKIYVTDESGAPIPKAQVDIMSSEDGKLLRFDADTHGISDLHLRPGEYQLSDSVSSVLPQKRHNNRRFYLAASDQSQIDGG